VTTACSLARAALLPLELLDYGKREHSPRARRAASSRSTLRWGGIMSDADVRETDSVERFYKCNRSSLQHSLSLGPAAT
jgi:hypothetical protein